MEKYALEYHPDVRAKDVPVLDPSIRSRIDSAILTKLAVAPFNFGKSLTESLAGARSLWVGDWRIAFLVRGTRVRILSIQHRNKNYRGVARRLADVI